MFNSQIKKLPNWSKQILKPFLSQILKNYNNIESGCYPPKDHIFDFMINIENIKLVILIPTPSYIWYNNELSKAGKNIETCLKSNKLLDVNTSMDCSVWKNNGIIVFPLKLLDSDNDDIWKNISDILLQYIIKDKCVIMFGKYNIDFKTSEKLVWSSPNISTKIGKDKFMLCPHFLYVNEKFNIKFDELYDEKTIETIEKNTDVYENKIYVDGGCDYNGTSRSIAGSSIVFKILEIEEKTIVHYFKIPHTIIGNKVIYPTSQRGEGMGILYALNYLNDIKNEKTYHINIITDSEFWIKMITIYMKKWFNSTNDYSKFIDHANSDITINMHKVLQLLTNRYNIFFKHIKSHNKDKNASQDDILGNKTADEYATLAKKLTNYNIVKTEL